MFRLVPLLFWLLWLLPAAACGEVRADGTRATDAHDPGTPDPAYEAAEKALAAGRPWQATRLITPLLHDSTRRTPEVVLLAATAASEWNGWAEVERLLVGEPWLDSSFAGEGHELLARAAIERGADSLAVRHARAATAAAASARDSAVRLVLLARSLDELDQREPARAAYEHAAELVGDVSDWLLLHAAGVTPDSAGRAALYSRVRAPLARERIPGIEAAARERMGDLAGAARAYAAMGDSVEALRLDLTMAAADAERADVRRALVALVRAHAGSSTARSAVALLDSAFAPLTAKEELAVARSAARSGPLARAGDAFAAAQHAGLGTGSRDRYTYASVLFRLRRYHDAAEQYARVTSPRSRAADAAYQRARATLRAGKLEPARTRLRVVLRDYPDEARAAAPALLLLADLATDERRDAAARDALLSLAKRYPHARQAPTARFRAALIAFAAGHMRTAAGEWDALRHRYPKSDYATGATYWSGRAWAAAGDSARARERWRAVMRDTPRSYYAGLSARRLGVAPWTPAAAPDSFPANAAVDSAVTRIALLDELGLEAEARLVANELVRDADSSLDRLLATANAFREHAFPAKAITLAYRALALGASRDTRVYRLLYPLVGRGALRAVAAEHDLDPALMAALIRQESAFNPHATSGAGARGLMQVMPRVGHTVARSLDFPVWDPVLLYQPDVNLQIGAAHLATLFDNHEALARILAAYNAGESRVERWATKRGMDDPELFTERIPFSETRNYVRIVLRNRDRYRALYEW